ncbi:uncharacterized protein LOC111829528 [Capsella rubella]|uniref:uncharacterized protein LOC111829528 n=1 Tax=Capsella rubella TaxID=81985 RepID=UPI000CD54871|nr:uncharacterized protein LOC111829528 [Capsella rubella]
MAAGTTENRPSGDTVSQEISEDIGADKSVEAAFDDRECGKSFGSTADKSPDDDPSAKVSDQIACGIMDPSTAIVKDIVRDEPIEINPNTVVVSFRFLSYNSSVCSLCNAYFSLDVLLFIFSFSQIIDQTAVILTLS